MRKYSPGLAQRVRSHTKHLTKHIKHYTFDLKHNTKHITLCTLHLHFAFNTKHITLCAYEKALALSSWGLRILKWSPWSLPGVYSESTRSLLGDGLEWLKPLKTDLGTFISTVGFGLRLGTVFGANLTPNGHPKWTKIDEKSYWLWVPSPEPFFRSFLLKTSPSSNLKMLIFDWFFQ